ETIIYLQFKSSVDYNKLSADDDIPIQIIKEGKVVCEYGSDYSVRPHTQDKIEARVYCDSGLVAVSNFTGTKKKLQKGIVGAITEIGHQP
ncbi:hypothetical protein, partial [Halorubrum sp. Atlit-26R]|uniref:hypothetical protein n=1 Tax=Halorubrum sp. Atlit-26R TaxID=2282128 RepID=UPI00131483CE